MLLCRHAGGGPVDEGADRAGRRAPLRRPRHRGGLAAPDRGGGRQPQQLGGAGPPRFEGPAHSGDLHLPPAPPAPAADAADHPAASGERARANGQHVLPFAVEVTDLIDGMVGFLEAPVSPAARTALDDTDPASLTWPMFL